MTHLLTAGMKPAARRRSEPPLNAGGEYCKYNEASVQASYGTIIPPVTVGKPCFPNGSYSNRTGNSVTLGKVYRCRAVK